MASKNELHRKALLAAAFAGVMLNSQMPALSENNLESDDSVIQQIAKDAEYPPEVRAYDLLCLAASYLRGNDKSKVDTQYRSRLVKTNKSWLLEPDGRHRNILGTWAEGVGREHKLKSAYALNERPVSPETLRVANEALELAIRQLDSCSETYPRLTMYFIASKMFQKTKNTEREKECNRVLETAIRSCEKESTVDAQKITTVSFVLNAMANCIINVEILDRIPIGGLKANTAVEPFTKSEYKKCENLRLRALAITDRLPPEHQVRRKAHRDMTLWYTAIGKSNLAEQQKQILFELVGTNDERILYPRDAACGSLVWWRPDYVSHAGCGMG